MLTSVGVFLERRWSDLRLYIRNIRTLDHALDVLVNVFMLDVLLKHSLPFLSRRNVLNHVLSPSLSFLKILYFNGIYDEILVLVGERVEDCVCSLQIWQGLGIWGLLLVLDCFQFFLGPYSMHFKYCSWNSFLLGSADWIGAWWHFKSRLELSWPGDPTVV